MAPHCHCAQSLKMPINKDKHQEVRLAMSSTDRGVVDGFLSAEPWHLTPMKTGAEPSRVYLSKSEENWVLGSPRQRSENCRFSDEICSPLRRIWANNNPFSAVSAFYCAPLRCNEVSDNQNLIDCSINTAPAHGTKEYRWYPSLSEPICSCTTQNATVIKSVYLFMESNTYEKYKDCT